MEIELKNHFHEFGFINSLIPLDFSKEIIFSEIIFKFFTLKENEKTKIINKIGNEKLLKSILLKLHQYFQ